MSQQLHLWVYTQKELKAGTQRDSCTATLTAASLAKQKGGHNPSDH